MDNLNINTVKSVVEILNEYQTSTKGLSENEAVARQKKYGKNELQSKRIHWYDIFFRQFTSPFIYLLILASLLAIYLGEKIDGIMILIFVIINAALGFYQEFRSEEALKILKSYITAKTKVTRNGKEQSINSSGLVPGDIISLSPGDKIPADLRFIESMDLTVDESILTGESVTVKKRPDPLSQPVKNIYEAANLGFSGTIVTAGKGIGVIIRIGSATELGKISRLTVETKHISSFEKGVARFSSYILRLIVITLFIVFAANILIKGPQANILRLTLFSIALAVSVIPEALPVVITFSLSHGALKLAKNKVVVKRLSAIEDLGGIEILCSDKTGTLTENKLMVAETYPEKNDRVVFYGALASAQKIQSDSKADSFDTAIWNKLTEKEIVHLDNFNKISELPFDPDRKRNSVLLKEKNGYLLIVRGAPEEILKISDQPKNSSLKLIELWIEKKGREGKRILGLAVKKVNSPKNDLIAEEKNLDFIGCIAFSDPVKSTAVAAIKKAEELGVAIKILTGDSQDVATAVAQQVGLIREKDKVITGEAFFKQSQENQHSTVNDYHVFARVSPEQKYGIIKLLQEKFEVGFLGEGINDAPALKIANVALVVDNAADIARDTADIVLLHKSLRVIVEGIRLGRETFSNTNKYIKATLSSNFGNFYTVAIASLLVNYLPLLPLQILLINMLTDFPMITVATDTIENEELQSPKKYDIKEIALIATLLGIVSSFFDFLFFVLFSRISPPVLQTNWFIGSVLTELAFLFSIRTKLPFFKAKKPSNIILKLSLFAACLAVILPFTTLGQRLFSFIRPSFSHLLLTLTIVILYLISTDIVKVLYYRSSFYGKTQTKKFKQ